MDNFVAHDQINVKAPVFKMLVYVNNFKFKMSTTKRAFIFALISFYNYIGYRVSGSARPIIYLSHFTHNVTDQ